jgi:hypothetical protein
MNFIRSNILKYQRFTTAGCKAKGIIIFEFMAKTLFLWGFSWKHQEKSFSELIPRNFFETIPKIFSRVS